MPCNTHITKGHHAGLVVKRLFLLVPALDGAWASKYFNLGYTPQGQHQRRAPAQGHLGQGICGLSGVILWLAESKCQYFSQGGSAVRRHISSNEEGQSGREKGKFPLPKKDDQSGKDAGHPATPCQASAHHSGLQQVTKCSVLSLNNSNSPFIWDGGHTHPSNVRPTVAWQGQSRSWLDGELSKTHPKARTQ